MCRRNSVMVYQKEADDEIHVLEDKLFHLQQALSSVAYPVFSYWERLFIERRQYSHTGSGGLSNRLYSQYFHTASGDLSEGSGRRDPHSRRQALPPSAGALNPTPLTRSPKP